MFANAYPDPIQQSSFYADVPLKRAVAWVFDTVLIGLLVALLIPLTGFLALFFLGGLYVGVSFLYRWIGLARHSATMGMRLMGLEFRDAAGYRIGAGAGFAHVLLYALSVAFVVPQILSVVMICMTRRGQSLTDLVLGVVLVNRSAMD
ncbi:MAG: RDD family protein [Candidatus Saccharibacteria bacterium]|nr:RDD family protein [Pseudorhodobacter sp.]